jgi:hypothetical protein
MAKRLIKKETGPIRHDHIYQIEFDQVPSFIRDCWSLEHISSIETLEVKKSFAREIRTDLSQQEALNKIYKSNYKFFSFVLRKSDAFCNPFGKKDYWEFCANGIENLIDYFVWIEVGEESGYKLVEKYNLIKNNDR